MDRVAGEADWLRGRVEDLEGELVRLRRRELGMPEVPLDRRLREDDPMPERVARLIAGYGNRNLQREVEREARRRVREGEATWDEVLLELGGLTEEG